MEEQKANEVTMTTEKFETIFEETVSKWEGDNTFQGLQIIAKYIDPKKTDIIKGASHDIIYSVDPETLVEAGITEEDVISLAEYNWLISDGCLASYV